MDSLSFALTPSMKIYKNSYNQHNTSNGKKVSRGQISLISLSLQLQLAMFCLSYSSQDIEPHIKNFHPLHTSHKPERPTTPHNTLSNYILVTLLNPGTQQLSIGTNNTNLDICKKHIPHFILIHKIIHEFDKRILVSQMPKCTNFGPL
jgi:hypothetical protein